MKKLLFILLIGISVVACDMAINNKVIGNYYLTAPDTGEQCSLTYKGSKGNTYSGIIPACVYAVGFNDDYIIAKQHPYEFAKELDKSVVQYYILPLKKGKNRNSKHDLIGPLSLVKFELEAEKFGIEDIEFTVVYDYLE